MLDTFCDVCGVLFGALVLSSVVWDRLCCCWRCLHAVITDAGSNPELAACASHFWSSGSVTVTVKGGGLFCAVGHCCPWFRGGGVCGAVHM